MDLIKRKNGLMQWGFILSSVLFLSLYGIMLYLGGDVAVKDFENKKQKELLDAFDNKKALFEAARVFGKHGCGDLTLALLVTNAALKHKVPVEILAAKVAKESNCNPLAVSKSGAVGLLQVMPSIWDCSRSRAKDEPCWNFKQVNLLNPEENLDVGAAISSFYIKKHGKKDGIAKYNGVGIAAVTYANSVLKLAGR